MREAYDRQLMRLIEHTRMAMSGSRKLLQSRGDYEINETKCVKGNPSQLLAATASKFESDEI